MAWAGDAFAGGAEVVVGVDLLGVLVAAFAGYGWWFGGFGWFGCCHFLLNHWFGWFCWVYFVLFFCL